MRVIGYTRVSLDIQVEEGISLKAQREKLVEWARLHEHVLVGVVEDPAVSGAIPPFERSGFRKVVEVLVQGGAEGVVSCGLDRYSRTTTDFLEIVARFKAMRWSIFSLREAIDTTTPAGELTVTMLAAFAQFERRMIGERTRFGINQLKVDNQRYSRWAPWGKRFEGDRLVDVPEEIEIADVVVEMFTAKAIAAKIATALNARFGEHPRLHKPWTKFLVHGIINARRRAGDKRVPPIVPRLPKVLQVA